MDEILFVLSDLKRNYKRVTYGKIVKDYEEIFGKEPNYENLSDELEKLESEGIVNKKLGVYYMLTDKIGDLDIPPKPNTRYKICLLGKFLKDKLHRKEWKPSKQYWKLEYYMEHWGGYIQ